MIDYDVIDEFAKRKKRQIAIAFILAPIILMKVFEPKLDNIPFMNETLILGVFLVIIFGSLIFSFINWRCPSCGKYLGKEISINHCKKCGVQLVDFEK